MNQLHLAYANAEMTRRLREADERRQARAARPRRSWTRHSQFASTVRA